MPKQIILASASPRRKELLERVQVPFVVKISEAEEIIDTTLAVPQAIENISRDKAINILNLYPDAIVIGADTVVAVEENRVNDLAKEGSLQILGKPENAAAAKAMLHLLSGRRHQVITAVSILSSDRQDVFHDVAEVDFYDLNDSLIDRYVQSGAAADKAGSYGIQDQGALFVKEIHGDFYTIMGLPIAKVYRYLLLHNSGIDRL